MELEALIESSDQRTLFDAFFRSERYFCRASFSETPPIKNALAARPIAYVPAPAIMPQTTLPHPGKNFRTARAPSRRSIPAPTFTPSAVINSVAARKLRSQNFSQLCSTLFRSEANTDDFGVGQRCANVMFEMQQDIGGFIGCWFFETRFPLVEKEYDVGRLTLEIFFDLSCGGIGCVTGIQDGNCSMAGYVPIDPSMHWHQRNIQLLWRAGGKKRVDDSVGR